MHNHKQIEKALLIAVRYHEGQYDKHGFPYVLHPIRVAERCEHPYVKAAAILHDVLEDTSGTVEMLQESGVHEEIIEIVVAVTKVAGEPYKEYLDRIREYEWAIELKLADMTDNSRPERWAHLSPEKQVRLAAKYARGRHYLLTGEWHTTPELEAVIKAGAGK